MNRSTCPAGHVLERAAHLGWQSDGAGNALELVVCHCRTTCCRAFVAGASICASCRGLAGDGVQSPKIIATRADATIAIYCVGCAPKLQGVPASVEWGRMLLAARARPRLLTLDEVRRRTSA